MEGVDWERIAREIGNDRTGEAVRKRYIYLVSQVIILLVSLLLFPHPCSACSSLYLIRTAQMKYADNRSRRRSPRQDGLPQSRPQTPQEERRVF